MKDNNNKSCYFKQNGIKYIDYKDTELLKKFLNPHARILGKKRTGTSAKYQRMLAQAVKRARTRVVLSTKTEGGSQRFYINAVDHSKPANGT